MYGIQSSAPPDGAYTTWDRWQDAEQRLAASLRDVESLKNALRIMGIDPDSVLGMTQNGR